MEAFLQGENGSDDLLDILLFVIRRNNDDAITFFHTAKIVQTEEKAK
jgi:hypothetical protein